MKSRFNDQVINSDIKGPCKDCVKRRANCHSGCADYIDYVEQKRLANDILRNANYRDNFSLEWRRGSLLERINRKNGK